MYFCNKQEMVRKIYKVFSDEDSEDPLQWDLGYVINFQRMALKLYVFLVGHPLLIPAIKN